MNPPSDPHPTQSETSLLIAFTRLEGKVDVALAQHGAAIDSHARELKDHEDRLRKLELTPTVTPRALWTTVASVAGVALAAVPFFDRIVN